ncbi:MAG TPA: MBOAT family protein [Bryobacteraceae bacterium]|nr:MBOAT family protein [Bryobacteraceae bacterium]
MSPRLGLAHRTFFVLSLLAALIPMLFNSLEFIFLFLPVVWIIFHLLVRNRAAWAIPFLAFASLLFYAWWDYRFVALLLASVLANYLIGRVIVAGRIGRIEVARKSALIVGIAANLAAISYYKYANFFLDSLREVGLEGLPVVDILLPLGISFYSFTQIAFLVDAYRGKAKEYKFSNYLLFVTYFPHLIAGPILHHGEMIPQFATQGRKFLQAKYLAAGLTVFAIGLSKKVLIADPLASLASPVFEMSKTTDVSTLEAWVASLAYTLQLYFDFSGYSDMAIGISLLFGIKLPINFNSPYKATNIIDFWRRWHITLSRFLRDYLYIPLGGSRLGAIRRYVNLIITMLLGGLWHGAAWTFVIWGGLHGLYLTINHAWRSLSVAAFLARTRWWAPVSLGITFLAVVSAWVLFRAESADSAIRILSAMAGRGKGLIIPVGMKPIVDAAGFDLGSWVVWGEVLGISRGLVLIPPLLLAVWMLPNAQDLFGSGRISIDTISREEPNGGVAGRVRWRPTVAWAAYAALLFVASLSALNRASEFLYYQF